MEFRDNRRAAYDWLCRLRDDYEDVIPASMVHSGDDPNAYKVRNAWWTLLNLVLEKGLSKGVFRSEFAPVAAEFSKRITASDFGGRLKTVADIRYGNKIVKQALAALLPESLTAEPAVSKGSSKYANSG